MLERIDTALKRAAEVANLELQRDGFELSPERLQMIQDQTTLLEDKLEFLDLEIAGIVNVPRKLNDLVAVRKKITAQMDIHRSLCAPVHRLFPELLSEIFVYATKSTSEASQLAVACKLASITVVWRRVAHGTPLLWTCLVAHKERQWNVYLGKIILLTGIRPLVAHCTNTRTTELFVTQPAMHARRWRAATLCSPIRAMDPAATRVEALNLEVLTIHGSGSTHPDDREVTDFLAMPRLRFLRLFLTNQYGVSQAPDFRLPTTLTYLTLTVWAAGLISFDVAGLLHQCGSTLQHLFIDLGETDDSGWSTHASMHALKSISLHQDGCILLEYIIAPILEQLTIGAPPAFFVRSLEMFMPFAFDIIHLAITGMPQLDDEEANVLLHCLRNMERLEKLHITDTTIPLDLVRSLICYENMQPVLPKLCNLSLESLPTPEHEAALRDVYASRRWSRYICGTDTAVLRGDPDEATIAETYVFDSDETSEWSEWYV